MRSVTPFRSLSAVTALLVALVVGRWLRGDAVAGSRVRVGGC